MYYWHKLRLITYAITYGNNSKEFKTITWMNDVCCQNTIMNKSMIFSGTTGEYFWCISRKRLSKVRPYSMMDLFLKVKKKMKSVFQINLTTVTHSWNHPEFCIHTTSFKTFVFTAVHKCYIVFIDPLVFNEEIFSHHNNSKNLYK